LSEENEIIDKKQQLMLEYLLSDAEVFAACYSITKPEYYDAPLDRVVKFAIDFFHKYGNKPNFAQIEAETGVHLKKRELDSDADFAYFLDEYEMHCRQSAMGKAILNSVDLVHEGKINEVEQLIREAMMVKITQGVGTELFDNPEDRITSMDEHVKLFSTGVKAIDEMIGYTRKGELIVVAASSSGGKSVMLANFANAYSKQKQDVCIISLELNELLYAKRLDAIIAGIDIDAHKSHKDEVVDYYNKIRDNRGRITLKFMKPQSTVSDIRAYLLEYSLTHGKYPDVLIVDYIALLGVTKTRSTNKFDIDEEKSIELRALAAEFNMIVPTAQQLNRAAADIVEINYGHIAGGLSLVNTSDATIALVASEEDLDNNQVQIKALKQRNARRTTKPVTLYKDPQNLRITENPTRGGFVSDDSSGKPKASTKDKLKGALSR
jgi:archaellum biogenesis ATPase FlaH